MRSSNRSQTVLFCILAGCWLLLAAGFIARTSHIASDGVRYFAVFDDGMVSLRYAKNFVQHHELAWNLGDRVEGFTDPLWTLIMVAAVSLFGTHYAPLAMQLAGAIINLGIFLIYYRTAIRNKCSGTGLAAGLLLLACSYPISYWALAGMEACAVCLVFSIALWAQYSYENQGTSNPLILHALLLVISFGLRPDGWLVIAPFFAACWFDSVQKKEYRRAFLAPAMVTGAVLSVLIARHLYYGEWMPNTYVLKMEGYRLSLRLRNGFSYVGQFYGENFLLLILLALSAFVKKRVAFLNILAACISLAYQVYVGGDPWLYWRQLLPVYVAVAFALTLIFDRMESVALLGDNVPLPAPFMRSLFLVVLIAPLILFEYLVYFGVISWIHNQYFLAAYAVAAFVGSAAVLNPGRVSAWARAVPLFIPVVGMLLLITVCGAIILGNHRFVHELTGKPFAFAEQARLIDKAVLASKLFGPGRTHHVIWAGTYPYYVEGAMIDALGKSDRVIARLAVDESINWNGMYGVPGHSKYNLRETILNRKPDIIVDYTAYERQDLSKEITGSYKLIQTGGVFLCVRNELTVGVENLIAGSCPPNML